LPNEPLKGQGILEAIPYSPVLINKNFIIKRVDDDKFTFSGIQGKPD
jgi:hypothetical protein